MTKVWVQIGQSDESGSMDCKDDVSAASGTNSMLLFRIDPARSAGYPTRVVEFAHKMGAEVSAFVVSPEGTGGDYLRGAGL